MKINDIVADPRLEEGFWNDVKSGYTAGKEDYIRRQAEKMGITAPQAAATSEPAPGETPPSRQQTKQQQTNLQKKRQPPTKTAPEPADTPQPAKPRVNIGRAATGPASNPPIQNPAAGTAKQPNTSVPKVAPKAADTSQAAVTYDGIVKSVDSLSAAEKQKLLAYLQNSNK